ncbi:outer membrane lipid asymmetry maintenance protein MlaD [Thiorhodococcus mannitoliphagus]|uniref:Outer membrane lipid asymmetry maintenance protein MlaD n=1 Tax=Thiorhodococcus mannitoliphagus TaxID=329406 RepID=A0A6P1DT23_9GAMM|nr:outer membrane lipid asymmetry maintenance protein MlaD [Thiorhodococcus mannitoliphagus]NEX19172.1 outer membrane lipid asymmetry maintenance protein MlaD [Thiorhodococcus mannitoliphagus]
MAKRQNVELMVGAFVALGLVALFFLAMKVSNLSLSAGGEGYVLTARFTNVGSLKVRAPVTMAGVRIGRVESLRFDKTTYMAVVTMRVDAGIDAIPEDTFANIFTSGLLGEQYIGLEPGGSTDYLQDGGEIAHTQSALVLEQMIGQFLFKKAGESG